MITTKYCARKSMHSLLKSNFMQCIIVASLLFGCSSSTTVTRDTTTTGLRGQLHQDRSGITTLRAYGTAQIKMPGAGYSATVDVSLHAPDSLRVKVNGPFGILMGIVFATRTSYTVYNVLDNTVTRGVLEPAQPLPFTGFPFRFDDAMQFLRGLPPETDSASTKTVSAFCVEGRDADGRFIKCEGEPDGDRKALIREPGGAEAYEYFRSFREINGRQFPGHISATMKDGGSVSIDFEEIEVNSGRLDFSIPYPSSAHVQIR